MFQGFDGLMTLSRREGVDIRPTLLRVLTDLYVQAATHTFDEERQFVELTSRLIDEVDDATRAAVRARLTTYPGTPREIRHKLEIAAPPFPRKRSAPLQPDLADDVIFHDAHDDDFEIMDAPQIAPQPRPLPTLSMQPGDAASLNEMFLAASSKGRAEILHNLETAPLKPSVRVDPRRVARAILSLEQAAMLADMAAFTAELGDALILPAKVAAQLVNDPQGEPLACAAKVLGMPGDVFQRVLLFLNPAIGSSVMDVYRLARMYDNLTEHASLIMLAAWRGSSIAQSRAKYRPALYDDERHSARAAPAQTRPAAQSDLARPPLRARPDSKAG